MPVCTQLPISMISVAMSIFRPAPRSSSRHGLILARAAISSLSLLGLAVQIGVTAAMYFFAAASP